MYIYSKPGGCRQVVKAVGCDSTIRRFNSGHPPDLIFNICSMEYNFNKKIYLKILCHAIEDLR